MRMMVWELVLVPLWWRSCNGCCGAKLPEAVNSKKGAGLSKVGLSRGVLAAEWLKVMREFRELVMISSEGDKDVAGRWSVVKDHRCC
ncbi:hypothetical protein V6N13_007829 [Hibiscus sabdariffa]